MKLFQFIIVLTLLIGLARDFVVHSNPNDLYKIVYTLFVVEITVDLILRLLNTRAFNWNYNNSPLYSPTALIVFLIFGVLVMLVMHLIAQILQLNVNTFVISTIPLWALGKYLNQAIILKELFLISSILELLRAIGLVIAVAQMSFVLICFVVILYALISAIIYIFWLNVNDVGYNDTIANLKSIISVDFRIVLQGSMITIIYVVDKSILNLNSSDALFLILVLKLNFIATSLLNRAYLHPFHVEYTNKDLNNSSLKSVRYYSMLFAGFCGLGVWILFKHLISFVPLELTLNSPTILVASIFTSLFVFREYSIRKLIIKHETSKLGNLGICYALSLALSLTFIPNINLEFYLIINILLLIGYLHFAEESLKNDN